MAKGLNSVQIIGNLAERPQLQYTQSGIAVANISVAVNYSIKQGDQYIDRVEWIRAVLWNKTAESAEKYLNKGSKVYLQGRMATRSWEDKENVKRWTTEVQVSNLIFLDSQDQKSDRPPAPPREDTEDGMTADPGDGSQAGGYDASEESSDVPF